MSEPGICQHCGAALPEFIDAFCPECRGDLEEPVATPQQSAREASFRRDLRITLIFAIAGGILGACRGIGTGRFSFLLGYVIGSAISGVIVGWVGVRIVRFALHPK